MKTPLLRVPDRKIGIPGSIEQDVILVQFNNEYITGKVPHNDPDPREWQNGHYFPYFNPVSQAEALLRAVQNLIERSTAKLERR